MTGICTGPCNDEHSNNKKGIQTALELFSSKVGIDDRLVKYFQMSTSDMKNHIWDKIFELK